MRPGLAVLQPMLIDDAFDLAGAAAVRAQRGEVLGPAVQEDGGVEGA